MQPLPPTSLTRPPAAELDAALGPVLESARELFPDRAAERSRRSLCSLHVFLGGANDLTFETALWVEGHSPLRPGGRSCWTAEPCLGSVGGEKSGGSATFDVHATDVTASEKFTYKYDGNNTASAKATTGFNFLGANGRIKNGQVTPFQANWATWKGASFSLAQNNGTSVTTGVNRDESCHLHGRVTINAHSVNKKRNYGGGGAGGR